MPILSDNTTDLVKAVGRPLDGYEVFLSHYISTIVRSACQILGCGKWIQKTAKLASYEWSLWLGRNSLDTDQISTHSLSGSILGKWTKLVICQIILEMLPLKRMMVTSRSFPTRTTSCTVETTTWSSIGRWKRSCLNTKMSKEFKYFFFNISIFRSSKYALERRLLLWSCPRHWSVFRNSSRLISRICAGIAEYICI